MRHTFSTFETGNTFTEEQQVMEARAITKNARISAFKTRHVTRLIQGKTATEALRMVELMPRKAARLVAETLKSAIANAENNERGENVKVADLVVKTAQVGEGQTLRRFRPKARGSAGRIRKRSSNIRIEVATLAEEKN
jgi:large subunit ribosomal protein L22